MKRPIVLTGITTSGSPHLGNYVGAIKPAIDASKKENNNSFFFLADYHAIVKTKDSKRIAQSTLEIASAWIALGLDPTQVTFYRQSDIPEITVQKRLPNNKEVFHLYTFQAKKRNELASYLQENGIDAKIHYPVPMHLQPAAKEYNYQVGDFPKSEEACSKVISLPVHEFISKYDLEYMIQKIREFYI